MNSVTKLLDGVVATGASASWKVPHNNKVLSVTGITTATVLLQGSLDDTNWVTLDSVTANGKLVNIECWKFIRANVSVWTSGVITVLASSGE